MCLNLLKFLFLKWSDLKFCTRCLEHRNHKLIWDIFNDFLGFSPSFLSLFTQLSWDISRWWRLHPSSATEIKFSSVLNFISRIFIFYLAELFLFTFHSFCSVFGEQRGKQTQRKKNAKSAAAQCAVWISTICFLSVFSSFWFFFVLLRRHCRDEKLPW